MATFTTNHTATGVPAKYLPTGDAIQAGTYTMTTTASATDVVQLAGVLAGARVTRLNLWANTSNITYSVGDGDNTSKFMTTASGINTVLAPITASMVNSIIRQIDVGAGLAYSYSVADTIDLRFDAACAGTGAIVYYVVECVYDQQKS